MSCQCALIGADRCAHQRTKEFQDAAFRFVSENVNRASRISLRHLAAAAIDPQGQLGLVTPLSSDDAPLFPCAGSCAKRLFL